MIVMKFNRSKIKYKPSAVIIFLCISLSATSLLALDNKDVQNKIASFEKGMSTRNIDLVMRLFKKDAVWQGFRAYPYVKENTTELFDDYASINLQRIRLELSAIDQRVASSADYLLHATTMQGDPVELKVSFVFLWEKGRDGWKIIATNPLVMTPVKDSIADDLKKIDPGNTTQNQQIGERLYPSADAYVYAYNYLNWNRSNRGKYDQLRAGWHPAGGESRAYLRFDFSGVKEKKVDKAVLRLYHLQTAGTNRVDLGIYRVTSPWKEGSDTYHSSRTEKTAAPDELSWVQQPSFDKHLTASFNPGTGKGDWIDVDVTPLVNQWLSGVPNNGLVIKSIRHQGTSVYHFASRERDPGLDMPKDKNKSPILTLASTKHNGNAPSQSKQHFSTNKNQKLYTFLANVWKAQILSEGKYSSSKNWLCIDSMNPGGTWFTTPRPYNLDRDYTVTFKAKLNNRDNHFPVLYSDGFVYIMIDWGTNLGHYQPGFSSGSKDVMELKTGHWYKIRAEAHPAKKSFDLYLDNKLISTAVNIKPLHKWHTLSPQINDKGVIWLGDADSTAFRGGRYNRGSVCWKDISVKQLHSSSINTVRW